MKNLFMLLTLSLLASCVPPGGGGVLETDAPTITDAPRQIPKSSGAADVANLRAFQDTVYPLVSNKTCVSCHGAQQSPRFAVSDIQTAYNELIGSRKVNLESPENSRLVLRLTRDGHHCWNADCKTAGEEMLAAIQAWKELVKDSGSGGSQFISHKTQNISFNAQPPRAYGLVQDGALLVEAEEALAFLDSTEETFTGRAEIVIDGDAQGTLAVAMGTEFPVHPVDDIPRILTSNFSNSNLVNACQGPTDIGLANYISSSPLIITEPRRHGPTEDDSKNGHRRYKLTLEACLVIPTEGARAYFKQMLLTGNFSDINSVLLGTNDVNPNEVYTTKELIPGWGTYNLPVFDDNNGNSYCFDLYDIIPEFAPPEALVNNDDTELFAPIFNFKGERSGTNFYNPIPLEIVKNILSDSTKQKTIYSAIKNEYIELVCGGDYNAENNTCSKKSTSAQSVEFFKFGNNADKGFNDYFRYLDGSRNYVKLDYTKAVQSANRPGDFVRPIDQLAYIRVKPLSLNFSSAKFSVKEYDGEASPDDNPSKTLTWDLNQFGNETGSLVHRVTKGLSLLTSTRSINEVLREGFSSSSIEGNLHSVLSNSSCINCHGQAGPQFPHSHADANIAFNAIRTYNSNPSLINLDDKTSSNSNNHYKNSLFYTKVVNERHNCGQNCDSLGESIRQAMAKMDAYVTNNQGDSSSSFYTFEDDRSTLPARIRFPFQLKDVSENGIYNIWLRTKGTENASEIAVRILEQSNPGDPFSETVIPVREGNSNTFRQCSTESANVRYGIGASGNNSPSFGWRLPFRSLAENGNDRGQKRPNYNFQAGKRYVLELAMKTSGVLVDQIAIAKMEPQLDKENKVLEPFELSFSPHYDVDDSKRHLGFLKPRVFEFDLSSKLGYPVKFLIDATHESFDESSKAYVFRNPRFESPSRPETRIRVKGIFVGVNDNISFNEGTYTELDVVTDGTGRRVSSAVLIAEKNIGDNDIAISFGDLSIVNAPLTDFTSEIIDPNALRACSNPEMFRDLVQPILTRFHLVSRNGDSSLKTFLADWPGNDNDREAIDPPQTYLCMDCHNATHPSFKMADFLDENDPETSKVLCQQALTRVNFNEVQDSLLLRGLAVIGSHPQLDFIYDAETTSNGNKFKTWDGLVKTGDNQYEKRTFIDGVYGPSQYNGTDPGSNPFRSYTFTDLNISQTAPLSNTSHCLDNNANNNNNCDNMESWTYLRQLVGSYARIKYDLHNPSVTKNLKRVIKQRGDILSDGYYIARKIKASSSNKRENQLGDDDFDSIRIPPPGHPDRASLLSQAIAGGHLSAPTSQWDSTLDDLDKIIGYKGLAQNPLVSHDLNCLKGPYNASLYPDFDQRDWNAPDAKEFCEQEDPVARPEGWFVRSIGGSYLSNYRFKGDGLDLRNIEDPRDDIEGPYNENRANLEAPTRTNRYHPTKVRQAGNGKNILAFDIGGDNRPYRLRQIPENELQECINRERVNNRNFINLSQISNPTLAQRRKEKDDIDRFCRKPARAEFNSNFHDGLRNRYNAAMVKWMEAEARSYCREVNFSAPFCNKYR